VHKLFEHIIEYSAVYTFVGVVITTLGFGVTLLVLWKTKNAASAAEKASKAVRGVLSRHDLLVEMPQCNSYLNEMVRSIRKEEYEAALIRANDCKDKLIRLLQAEYFKKNTREGKQIRRQVQILGTVVVSLNEALKNKSAAIDFSEAVKMSTETQSVLSECIGKAKNQA
jgi:hypothetical protein